ncbi:MAG: hypothetical protein ACREXU_21590 [Gammaproteobacteria bacterium]
MSRVRWKRMGLGLAWAAGCLAMSFGTALGLLLWSQSEPPLDMSRKLAALRPWFFLWRLVLFGSLIAFWPAVCRSLARWRKLTYIQRQCLRSARWQVAAWLVALELLLGQNVVGRFINLLVA